MSHMEHRKYAKMGSGAVPSGAGALAGKAVKWVVTEKVHGSNLALVVEAGDGGAAATAPTVRIARRRGFIAPGEDFFGLTGTDGLGLPAGATAGGDGGLQARLEAMALKAFTAWRGAAAGERDVMWIYGELFGGMYPHEDVEEDPARRGRAPVQRGVYYCPELRFMVFDIATSRAGHGGDRTFLDFLDQTLPLAREAGFLVAEPLQVTTLSEAMAYKIGFDSTLPARFGLPPLPKGTNKAEGVVVRSAVELTTDPAGSKDKSRAMVKLKIPEFCETKYDDSAPTRVDRGFDSPSHAQMLQWEADAALTETRLDTAISKVGALDATADSRRCTAILREFVADVGAELVEAAAHSGGVDAREHCAGGAGPTAGGRDEVGAAWCHLGLTATEATALRSRVAKRAKQLISNRVRAFGAPAGGEG